MYFKKNTSCIFSKNYKRDSLVVEDKMLMINTIHFEWAYVTWKGQTRFFNIKNSKIGVLLELSSHELYS